MQHQKRSNGQFNSQLLLKHIDATGQCYQIPTTYTGKQKRQFTHQICYQMEHLFQILNNYNPLSKFNIQNLRKSNYLVTKKYRQAIYYGQCKDGQKNGKGIMLYTNTRLYQGQWFNNFKHGKGYQRFPNRSVYEGDYAKGKPQGFGRYEWSNGEVYEGEWIDGLKNGSGIWRGSKGDSYIGEWKDGKADGYGVHTWINGDRYQGQFKNCLKHGEGVQKFANGDSYKGFYQNGKPNGYGQYYWAEGSFFKGIFKNGLREGNGVWKKGVGNTDKYEGQYKNDKKQGYGVFSWANGSIYKGNYNCDQRQGYGQIYWSNGSFFKGQWLNGVHQGEIMQNLSQSQNIQNSERKKMRQKILVQEQDQFLQEIYNEPERPHVLQVNKKAFRARGLTSNKSCRHKSYAQHPSPKSPLNYSYHQPKLTKKYSVGSRIDNQSNTKLSQPSSYHSKNISASFFLYKIHKNQSMLEGHTARRMVKTSGGIRNRQIAEEVIHFTKAKINCLQFQ